MKIIIRKLTLIGWVVIGAMVISGQVAVAEEKLDATMEALKIQRKAYIEEAMELSLQEKEAFWTLYDEYLAELSKIRERLFKLFADFVEKQGYLSDAEALNMLDENLKIDAEEDKLMHVYLAKFKKVLPGRKVVRLYQLEFRFDTAASSMLFQNIPLIR